jgi:hypothetical protein
MLGAMGVRRRVGWFVLLLGVAGAIVAAVLVATRGTASGTKTRWGKAIEVPGVAALEHGGQSQIDSLSCARAGNCTANGEYRADATSKGFVAKENGGVWGPAVPRDDTNGDYHGVLVALKKSHLDHGGGSVGAIVCAKPGFCVAGGSYGDGHTGCGLYDENCTQAFVVNETNGVWGKAVEVAGTARINVGGEASLDTISCWSVGNCTAVGTYTRDITGFGSQSFLVQEKDGVWGTAVRFPFPVDELDADANFSVLALFCDSARSCTAVGSAEFADVRVSVFVASETNGVWGKAIPPPGLEPLEDGANGATIGFLTCTTARFCTAGGEYEVGVTDDRSLTSTGYSEPFLVTEKNGVWGNAFTPPDFDDLNTGRAASLFSLVCPAADACVAGGSYTDDRREQRAFVVTETKGVWNRAIEVPGLHALDVGRSDSGSDAQVDDLFCVAVGSCIAGGYYTDRAGRQHAFVTAP